MTLKTKSAHESSVRPEQTRTRSRVSCCQSKNSS